MEFFKEDGSYVFEGESGFISTANANVAMPLWAST